MNNFTVSEFSHEIANKLDNYVYRLIDPRNGETFYVGRGVGNRVFQHIKFAHDSEDESGITEKNKTILDIKKSGLEVVHVIHRHGLTKESAIEVEAALIDAYQGISNILAGQGSNDFGPMHAYQIITRYSAEEVEFHHKVVMITINRSASDKSVYDAVRYAWRISQTKAMEAEYVLAVEKGIVVGVFKVDEWKEATLVNFPEFGNEIPGRLGFTGREAEVGIRDLYLHKRIPDSYRQPGASNPIKYSL